jgi:3D (Asp-Asp-Asp) domain-containing protein
MIRYFCSVGLVLVWIGLPLHAKDTTVLSKPVSATSSTSTSKGHGDKSSDKSAVAKAKTSSPTKACDKDAKTTASVSTAKKNEASHLPAKTASVNSKGTTNLSGRITSAAKSIEGRLARLTAYWAGEGDYYTGRSIASTGIRLHGGHCAVDPSVIPYGSVVEIAGLGTYLAVDTGSDVISRKAAREIGHSAAERSALVVDLFFESSRDGQRFAANGPKYATISWHSPRSADNQTKESRGLMAEENWSKAHNKDL